MDSNSEAHSSPRSNGLHDVIVTLPVAAIVSLCIIVLAAMGISIAVLLRGPDTLQAPAGQALVVLLPMLFAIAAAIGIRRTSTKQIDELVARFLERSVLDRLRLACHDHANTGYPFLRADLIQRACGRSYASYQLDWADGFAAPARVDVKMNVFNVELIAELLIDPSALKINVESNVELIDRASLNRIKENPLLRSFQASLQGSVEEGYAIRIGIHPQGEKFAKLQFSLRQKMEEHFLASPFLKRYFAEDLAIVIGVIYNELRDSGLRTAPQVKPKQ